MIEQQYKKIMEEGGYKLLPKIAFKFSNNTEKLLNGITTNELDKDTNAFLDRFGKLVALADQKIIGDDLYIIIEDKYQIKFLQHINNYIKLSDTKMQILTLSVVHILNDNFIGDITFKKNIGYLSLLENLDSVSHLNKISDEVYDAIRLENDIPIQGIEFDNNMFLETGLYDTVSFTKGCYLGQEIIARVHNLGKPPRKLIRILYDKIPESVTVNGEKVGDLTSKCFSYKYSKYLVFAIISKYDQQVDDGEILRDQVLSC